MELDRDQLTSCLAKLSETQERLRKIRGRLRGMFLTTKTPLDLDTKTVVDDHNASIHTLLQKIDELMGELDDYVEARRQ